MRFSIKNKIVLAVIMLLALLTGLQTWLQTQRLSQETQATLASHSAILADATADGLQKWFNSKQAVINSLEGRLDAATLVPALSQARIAGDFQLVYFGSEAGRMVADDPAVHFAPEYDPRSRPWYRGALKNGQYVSPPYVDATTGELVITVAKRVEGGVVGGDLSLEAVIQRVRGVTHQGLYAFVTDNQGQLLIHPDAQRVLQSVSRLSPALDGAALGQLSQSNRLFELTLSGQASLVQFSPIPDTAWVLALAYDKSQALASVTDQLQRSLLFNLLLFGVMAITLSLIIHRLLTPLTTLREAIDALAQGDGDLTRRIPLNREDEIGTLAGLINRFVDKLHRLVTDIAGTSAHLRDEARLAGSAAERSRHELTGQQQEITQIATAVNEMSATAGEVAGNAGQTAEAARESALACEQGTEVIARNQRSITQLAQQLLDASSTVQQLEKNTQEINVILSTIQGIAEQTNLLALNAAIEAARAGEQGRGFAVVADEVRVLSQRTHSSTEEIRAMIERLQCNTQAAVKTMQESQALAKLGVEDADAASRHIEQITAAIVQISDMASQISSAAEEQRAVTDEVSRNTQAIKDVSDEQAEQAISASQRAGELNDIAAHLDKQMGVFRI